MKGKLHLVVLWAFLTGLAHAANPQPVVVHTFTCNGNALQMQGSCPNGGRPDSLIQGSDGNFYGTAQVSSEGDSAPTGGTVFSLTPSGKFTLLHTFSPGANLTFPNGNNPSGVLEGPDGKLYGQTLYGGVGGANGPDGSGVLYRVNRNGSGFQVIHKFCSRANCADGSGGALVVGNDGNLYGASYYGGTGVCFSSGCGTIFRVTPSSGAYAVVFNFNSSTIGENPTNLTMGADGTFYGVDFGTGGENMFHYAPATGAFETVALNFPLINGRPARGGMLTLGPNGNFYGLYGAYGVNGEGLYEVQLDGSNLQAFPFYNTIALGGSPDGLLLASDSNFWVADYSGSSGYGDIITLSPADGKLIQTLSPFSASAAVGAYPVEIIQAKDGTLWGSTDQYGKAAANHFADGTIFSLNVGLPPK
jgi:uncharacterized repeat protein (TIGR03803 family)